MKQNDLKAPEVFISERRIRRKISEMAETINSGFGASPLTVVYISNGAMIFTADLVRKLAAPVRIDSISAFSYSGAESSGKINMRSQIKLDIKGRNVLLVDDILDTGRTISGIRDLLLKHRPSEMRICVLLDKPSRRAIDIKADYVGFTVPDEFVVGYGLDYDEHFRNLPYIGILTAPANPPATFGL